MRTVVARYRHESDGAWIATVRGVEGFYAYGDSFEETRDRVQVGLPEFLGEPDMLIAHLTGVHLDDSGTRSPRVTFGKTKTSQPSPRYVRELSGKRPQSGRVPA
jgi:predicted RNase H-like HicB family nuclease